MLPCKTQKFLVMLNLMTLASYPYCFELFLLDHALDSTYQILIVTDKNHISNKRIITCVVRL